jgi:hypothetical protein
MTKDEVRGTYAGEPPDGAGDPRDDWLGSSGDLDWFEDDSAPVRPPAARPRPGPAERPADAAVDTHGPHAHPDERSIRRRRAVAALALVALAALALVLAIAVLGGSGGGGGNPATTTTTTPGKTPTHKPTHTTTTTTTTTASTTATTTTTPSTGGSTTGPVTLPSAGKLVKGDTGAEVTQVQQALTTIGFNPGAADGNFGAQTEQAVIAFQKANGLTTDGVVGPATAAKLNEAVAAHGG